MNQFSKCLFVLYMIFDNNNDINNSLDKAIVLGFIYIHKGTGTHNIRGKVGWKFDIQQTFGHPYV